MTLAHSALRLLVGQDLGICIWLLWKARCSEGTIAWCVPSAPSTLHVSFLLPLCSLTPPSKAGLHSGRCASTIGCRPTLLALNVARCFPELPLVVAGVSDADAAVVGAGLSATCHGKPSARQHDTRAHRTGARRGIALAQRTPALAFIAEQAGNLICRWDTTDAEHPRPAQR